LLKECVDIIYDYNDVFVMVGSTVVDD